MLELFELMKMMDLFAIRQDFCRSRKLPLHRTPHIKQLTPHRMPPHTSIDSYYTLLRSGLWRLYYKLCPEGRFRMFSEFFPLLHDTKAEVLGTRDPESWYLVYLGTRGDARGKGLARRLVGGMLDVCDAQGKACYLESSNVANVGLYEKMGFQVVRRIVLCRGERAVEMDIMVCAPALWSYWLYCWPVQRSVSI